MVRVGGWMVGVDKWIVCVYVCVCVCVCVSARLCVVDRSVDIHGCVCVCLKDADGSEMVRGWVEGVCVDR